MTTNRVDLVRKQLRLLRRATKALEQLLKDLKTEEKQYIKTQKLIGNPDEGMQLLTARRK